MKKYVLLMVTTFALAFTTLAPSNAHAQGDMAAGGLLTLPVGDWGDVVDLGIGGVFEYHYGLSEQLSLVGTAGLVYFLTDFDGATLLNIPILVGAKYNVAPKIHLLGQAGLNIAYASIEGFDSNTETEVTLNLGAGYELGNLDLRASLWFPTIDELGDFGLTVSAIFHFGGSASK